VALTIEKIRSTENSEALLELLSEEWQRLLPAEALRNRDLYHRSLETLPRGLRAMAGMHFFDVSMALDNLAWHFGNQADERDRRETLNGLRELEMSEIADLFENAWKIVDAYLDGVRKSGHDGAIPKDWYMNSDMKKQIESMDKSIREQSEKAGDAGLLGSWPIYARKYPERCVLAEA
jgi:hypothetical protein